MTTTPIDAFLPLAAGVYRDAVVSVRREDPRALAGATTGVTTEHFHLDPGGSRVELTHWFEDEQVSEAVGGMLVAELFSAGWLRGVDLFERLVTGIVRTIRPNPLDAWELFYRNSLRDAVATGSDEDAGQGLEPVRRRALALVDGPGPVLELGGSLGLLSLRLARGGHATTCLDLNPGSVRLLALVAERLGTPLTAVVGDATRLEVPDDSFDTVLAIHLLEHLDDDGAQAVVAEAVRVARRRVVVAVPYEDPPEESYGHVRSLGPVDLKRWGEATQLPYGVTDHHGGWLVIDAAVPGGRSGPCTAS